MTALKLFVEIVNLCKKYKRQVQQIDIDYAIKNEEQQIKDAYNQGFRDGKEDWEILLPKDIAEYSNAQNYYNETFKVTL